MLKYVLPLLSWPLVAASTPVGPVVAKIFEKERQFVEAMATRSPVVETYIQETSQADSKRPPRDHYFLGRASLTPTIGYTTVSARTDVKRSLSLSSFRSKTTKFVPAGFAQMVFLDPVAFNEHTYDFEYVRREFLGEVRCLVFDVKPLRNDESGRFVGRIWAEDKDFRIVRFNGTYTGSDAGHMFFHFDSWRINVAAGVWVPALIYTEEADPGKRLGVPPFKAQTRFWGYTRDNTQRLNELAQITVDSADGVVEKEIAAETSPLENQRLWERQAELNVLDRLQDTGLISPKGEVDQVLATVLNNLIATNDVTVDVDARVLLTTPLESFTVGRTIIISKGLLDVLPDEASLATVLAQELAHVALGHKTRTEFAFTNRTMLSDDELLSHFAFTRTAEEVKTASIKALEFLNKSPYQAKLANVGLFLKAAASRAPAFPNLIRANFGNQLCSEVKANSMQELTAGAPELDKTKLDQVAALPLGSRIKLDPWTNRISMMKVRSVPLLSQREKLDFELTPVLLHLTRVTSEQAATLPSSIR